jgi:alkylation response protein AidB-like acyl-CoA dehydrogenase
MATAPSEAPEGPAPAFCLTSEQEATLALADQFGRAELLPLAGRMDDEEWWPPEVFPKLGEAGLLGVTIPASEGGPGLRFSIGQVPVKSQSPHSVLPGV